MAIKEEKSPSRFQEIKNPVSFFVRRVETGYAELAFSSKNQKML
jgi:hypothetical protein